MVAQCLLSEMNSVNLKVQTEQVANKHGLRALTRVMEAVQQKMRAQQTREFVQHDRT